MLSERALSEFADLLAARTPVPGSGCAAAAIGALGAALASMALRVGRGEDPPEVVELERLRAGLLADVEADGRAYQDFLAARAGRGDLARARQLSIDVPRRIAEASLAALACLERGVRGVKPPLHSETLTSSQALLAAVEGASFTALANLPALPASGARDPEREELEALRARARELACALRDFLHAPRPSA